jgi:hypothetical protein
MTTPPDGIAYDAPRAKQRKKRQVSETRSSRQSACLSEASSWIWPISGSSARVPWRWSRGW